MTFSPSRALGLSYWKPYLERRGAESLAAQISASITQNRQGRDIDGYSDLCTASRHIRPKFQSLAVSVKKLRALPLFIPPLADASWGAIGIRIAKITAKAMLRQFSGDLPDVRGVFMMILSRKS